MKIDDHYTIEHDSTCWTLSYEKIGDINPDTEKPKISKWQTYHISLKQALEAYFDAKLAEGDNVSPEGIKSLYGAIKTFYEDFKKL